MKGILKRITIAATILILCAGAMSCGSQSTRVQDGSSEQSSLDTTDSAENTDETKFVILHTNDVHGFMEASDRCLGMEAVAQLKKDYEQQGYDVLLMDAGDMLQGNAFASYSQGESIVTIMNAAGYDVMALGNHDFDYGADVLEKRMSEMDFPALAANITVDATGEPFAEGNAVFTLSDGTKVGVFGLDTPTTSTTSAPKNTAGLSFASGEELYALAQAQIDELKDGGCSVIVCLGHLGEEDVNKGNVAKDIAENTEGLSVLIDGHDHRVEDQTVKDREGNDVLIVEAGSFLRNIGILTYEDGSFTESLAEAGSYMGSDPDVAELVAGFSAEIKAALGETVAVCDFDLPWDAVGGEGTLADLAVDSIYWQVTQAAAAAPDAAILNGGAIRASVKAGEIRLQDVCDLFPFNNQLCTIEVTGAQLLEAMEAATQTSPEPISAFPQVSRIRYTLDTTVPYEEGELYPGTTYHAPAAPGARITIHEVGGKEFDPEATYTIATIDFLASGGDTYYCFAEAGAASKVYVGYLDSDGLANYMKTELEGTIPEIYAEPQGRIEVIGGK